MYQSNEHLFFFHFVEVNISVIFYFLHFNGRIIVLMSFPLPLPLSVSTLSCHPFCLSQRETDGLERLPVGEKQEEYHHGVISCQQNNPAPCDTMLCLI